MAGLTNKQKAFVEEYLQDFNATRAAQRAGYSGELHVLAAQGSRLLRNVNIAEKISQRLQESAMSADEVLWRLGSIARGEHSEYITPEGAVDLPRLLKDGKGYLIRGIRRTRQGDQIEFYDSQKALVDIGKHHGLFEEETKLTGAVTWTIVRGDESKNTVEEAA